MLYLYKFTKYVSHNWFHWTLPLPVKGGTTASQGRMTGHTLLLVSLHTSRHCSNWMRLTRRVNAVAGFIELCAQSPILSPKTFKQLNVLMFANEYSNNALFNYQTINCTNKQCFELECEPATLPLYCVVQGTRQVDKCGLGHGSQRQSIVHFIPARGRVQWNKIRETNFGK